LFNNDARLGPRLGGRFRCFLVAICLTQIRNFGEIFIPRPLLLLLLLYGAGEQLDFSTLS